MLTKEILIQTIRDMSAADYQKWLVAHHLIDVDVGWIDTKFEEFWNIFPQKTPKGRVLRALRTTAKTAATAQALFKREIKSEEEADLAIRGLKLELINRRQTNGLEYINNVQTYIRNKNWELYDGVESDIDTNDIDIEEGSSFNML